MTNQRLHEAFAKEMGRKACDELRGAMTHLRSVARSTGDQRFESLVGDLYEMHDRIKSVSGHN